MPKKSKPKPRTNWKQRALHCEEVIGVQNVLANRHRNRVEQLARGLKYWQDRAAETRGELEQMAARAESAEKHNALLLEEREARKPKQGGDPCCAMVADCDCRKCFAAAEERLDQNAERLLNAIFEPTPTHWQRFKSWLSRRGK